MFCKAVVLWKSGLKYKHLKINVIRAYTWVLLRNGQPNGQANGQLYRLAHGARSYVCKEFPNYNLII